MQISILAIEKRVMLLYWPLGTDPYFFEEGLRQLLKQNSCTAKTVACVAGAGGKGWGNRVKRKGESPPSLSFSSISPIPLCVCYTGYKNCGNKIKQGSIYCPGRDFDVNKLLHKPLPANKTSCTTFR